MHENEDRPDFEAVKSEVTKKLREGQRSATEALHDARDQITEKATDYASEAKVTLTKQAEATQQNISSNLSAFGGALRAASEHLANADQRTASKFVLDAAGGLERLSSSLKDKPFADVLDEVRTFGQNNSGALIAGSVFAGLALGRFVKSARPVPTGTQQAKPSPSDQARDDKRRDGENSGGGIVSSNPGQPYGDLGSVDEDQAND